MSKQQLAPMAENSKAYVDYIKKAYEDELGVIHGYQKDAIQNCVGARAKDRWDNFRIDFDLIENSKGTFLVVTDRGTEGLTGPNWSASEIKEYAEKHDSIPANYRLARFTSKHFSGGIETGGGLYGAGKQLHVAVSEDYKYYFDSIRRNDGKYVANLSDEGQAFENGSLEGEDAKKFIYSETGLKSLSEPGTRVIIAKPVNEIVNAMNSGEFHEYISETWWLIISKMPPNSGIYVNKVRVEIPAHYSNPALKIKQEIKNNVGKIENGYQVKNIGLEIIDGLPDELSGFHFYRKGMKLGKIRTPIIDSYLNNYYGFIELDKTWEDELASYENITHYDVESRAKHTKCYRTMVNYVNTFASSCLSHWGYIKDEVKEEEITKAKLAQIKDELESLANQMEFDEIGKGDKDEKLTFRWLNIKYPNSPSKIVTSSDKLNFEYKISNRYFLYNKFRFKKMITNKYSQENHLISDDILEIDFGTDVVFQDQLIVDKESSYINEENEYVLVLEILDTGKKFIKSFNYFYDCDERAVNADDFRLVLNNHKFPKKNNKRINFGELLRDVEYKATNRTEYNLEMVLRVRIHHVENQNRLLKKLDTTRFEIRSQSEELIPIGNILFDEEFYSQFLIKGTLELRADLVSNESLGDIEKGEKLARYYLKIFLNQNEKKGLRDLFDFHLYEDEKDFKRAYIKKEVDRWGIYINIKHPAYIRAQRKDYDLDYMQELVVKKFISIYAYEGNYSFMNKSNDEIKKMSLLDFNEEFELAIERIYNEYVRNV